MGQHLGGDAFGTHYSHSEPGYPSPMDYGIVENQAFGRRGGAPGQICAPLHSTNYAGHLSNNHPLTSSPVYDSLSSATFPGSEPSQSASRNTSTNTSFSNAQGLPDPFTGKNCNEYSHGLPAQDPPTLGNWDAQSNQIAAMASFDTGHQYHGYNDGQISSGYANPTLTMPASSPGLGISQSHPADNNFGHSTEAKAGHAFHSHAYLDQSVAPAFGTAMGSADLGDPYDQSFVINDFFNENSSGPTYGNDCEV